MIQITPHMRIFLCIAPIDFRKGIDGLSRVCRDVLDQNPFSGSMFIFRNNWLETFVDMERFKGTCYKSANWLYLGQTRGLGKNARSRIVNRSLKAVWGYPLHRNFRELLSHG